MDLKAIRTLANTLLYEGHMLYPYRLSALKNRSQGWTFGTLLPEQYAALYPGEPDRFEAQMLVVGAASQLSIELRFLQLCGAEALERTISFGPLSVAQLLAQAATKNFVLPQCQQTGPCMSVAGSMRISAYCVGDTAARLTIAVSNQSLPGLPWDSRDAALQQALVSAHALLTVVGGEFVSLLSPPDHLSAAVADCKQIGVFPILVGEKGDFTAVLVSPFILDDYPRIAPSSHGDFFDSTEIDEILTLRVLTLTDAEKEEIRAANGRAREMLQRTESLTSNDILKLHGLLSDTSRSGGR
jgi:hypothetical protein